MNSFENPETSSTPAPEAEEAKKERELGDMVVKTSKEVEFLANLKLLGLIEVDVVRRRTAAEIVDFMIDELGRNLGIAETTVQYVRARVGQDRMKQPVKKPRVQSVEVMSGDKDASKDDPKDVT